MSNELINLLNSKKVGSHMRKVVLVAMADRANDDGGGIWISKVRIAKQLECSRQSVIDTIKGLLGEADGDRLLVPVGKRKGHHGYVIEYRISVANVRRLPDLFPKCTDMDTLDPDIGSPEEISTDAEIEAVSSVNVLDTSKSQVSKSGRSSVNVIGKNPPYRTNRNSGTKTRRRSGEAAAGADGAAASPPSSKDPGTLKRELAEFWRRLDMIDQGEIPPSLRKLTGEDLESALAAYRDNLETDLGLTRAALREWSEKVGRQAVKVG